MTENVLKYFAKNCGTRNRVLRYIKGHFAYLVLSCILLFVIPFLYWINNLFNYKGILLLVAVLLANLRISVYFFSEKAKETLAEKYALKKWKGMWNDSWEIKRIFLMEDLEAVSDYLKQMKCEKCVPLIREDLIRRKQKYEKKLPLIPAMIGAIIVAEYNNYSAWDYSNASNVSNIIGKHLAVIFIITVIALSAKRLRDIFFEMVNLKRMSDVEECLKVFEYLEMNGIS